MALTTAPTKFTSSFQFRDVLLVALLIVWFLQVQNNKPPNVSSASSTVQLKTKLSTTFPSCTHNPYLGALEPLSNITNKMDDWFDNFEKLGTRAMKRKMYKHDWERFFPFDELSACNERTCVGGKCSEDRSKIVCGLSLLKKIDHCVVYSIGGNNQWEFELSILKSTPCEVYTFDCTGKRQRFKVPKDPRLHFHHVCITPYPQDPDEPRPNGLVGESWTLLEMQRKLGHSRIDLLKVDIEGFEHPLFWSWPELYEKEKSEQMLLPMQILAEVHYQTYFDALHPDLNDFKTATELLEFQRHLMRMGYIVTVKDDNPTCPHCTELTFIRARCPNTGVYANL